MRRSSNYLPHAKREGASNSGQLARRGRVVWDDNDSMGAYPAPRGTFPWMVSLFVLLKNGEALFMCAGTLLTPNIAVTAAHCFTNNERKTTWYNHYKSLMKSLICFDLGSPESAIITFSRRTRRSRLFAFRKLSSTATLNPWAAKKMAMVAMI